MANAWNRGTDRGNRGAGRGTRGTGRGNRGAGRGQNAFQGRGSRGRGGMQRQPQNNWQTKNTGEWGTEMERKQGGASAGAQREGMSDGSQVYMCELCDVPTTGLQNLEMHKKGQKHRANVARQEKGEEIHKGSRNKSSGKKRKIASDGSEIQEIQPVIDSCLEPLVGLELIVEYFRQEWQTESIFYCTLCESRISFSCFIPHVTGYRHRYGYIKLKRPDAKDECRVEAKDREVTTTTESGEVVTQKIEKRNRTEVSANITRVCLEILSEEGLKKMQRGVDPDPPEMPVNRLKKTMHADSRMQLKALNADDFKRPVSNSAQVPLSKRKRMNPRNSQDQYDQYDQYDQSPRGRGKPPFNKARSFGTRPGAGPSSSFRGRPRRGETSPFSYSGLMRERQNDLWAMEEELMYKRWRLALMEEEERQYQRPLGMKYPRDADDWRQLGDRDSKGMPPPYERKSFLEDRPRVSPTLKDLYKEGPGPRWSKMEGPVMRRNRSEME
ncbi:uncharacterized protein [Diadema setosum]|uniref:uncharacterized protein isoform X2 n=1 Tax=Diadema setosum TaxID=31175 RepID=UPI003B3A6349